ncbi:MAG: hypothetical protein IJC50_08665 [Clostridia bacterium]|nr:hypothetical protein [Clostridia bacterium]
MKKRILSLLLCAVMLIPMMLTGCDDGGYSTVQLKQNPITLTIYTITDEKTTDEGLKQAQDAINEITEYDFNTRIVLKAFTADEYKDMLMADIESAAANYEEPEDTLPVDTTAAEDDGEEGITTESKVFVERDEIVYPDLNGTQVDIVLINSIDLYNELVQNGHIQSLDVELQNDAKIINKFVNPIFTDATVGVDEMHYAIPNNRMVGEYEYLLLNKELVDNYYYSPEDILKILQLEEYVEDVNALNPDYIPVLDTYGVGTLSISMLGKESVFGSYVNYGAKPETNAMPKNLLEVSTFRRELAFIHDKTVSGDWVNGEFTEDTKAAAVFLKGDSTVPEVYGDDYYVNVYKYPSATNENVFASMYAVSTYSKSVTRCMQIIEYMVTNHDFRNTFQYGMRDVNYSLDKDNFVTILNDEYVMDPMYTGNQFILYQNDRMTEQELALSANDWELAKKQNSELVASPYLGFSALTTEVLFEDTEGMTESEYSTAEMLKEVEKLSDEYMAKIDQYDSYVAANGAISYEDYLKMLGSEMKSNVYLKAALSAKYTNSPFARYVAWYKFKFSDVIEAAKQEAAAQMGNQGA